MSKFSIDNQKIIEIINTVTKEDEQEIQRFLDYFFENLFSIKALNITLTGKEQEHFESALESLIQISTYRSTVTVLRILQSLEILKEEN